MSSALQPPDCSMPGFPDHHQFLELAQTHVRHVSDDIQLSHSLASPSHAFNPFQYQNLFHIRWPKYWSFSFNINPSNEYSGLISFRVHWFAHLAVQGTLKGLQHHGSKVSVLWRSAFFTVQLCSSIHDYWKNHGFDYMEFCRQSNVSAF